VQAPDLSRALSLSEGFLLVPVEVRGPDAARELARWLEQEGWKPALVEPLDEPAWHRLVADVMDAASAGARVVVVVGGRDVTPGMLAALRLVNQRRDSIAEALARPLLWCGPPEFLKLTWERAPDFWSVRAMTTRLETSNRPVREAPLWPSAWVADPPERLREMLEGARRQNDAPNAARAAAMLAQALVAHGELAEAAEVIDESRPASPELALVEGIIAALRGDRARAEQVLGDSSWSSAAPEVEGRRLVALGNLVLDESRDRAVDSYEKGRALLHDARDGANEAVAIANLGVASMAGGALDDAAARLEEALAVARDAGDALVEARVLSKLGRVRLLERDSRRACAVLEEALVLLRGAGDARGEHEALRHLAHAYLELGDPEKAEGDARRAAQIARAVGDEESAREAEVLAAEARAEMS
jgi:tetratricopeptide (TPR) repeat protein